MTVVEKIVALRAAMEAEGADGVYVPSSDPHMTEYLPARWRCRAWLSGFTGSAGTLCVTREAAALWTDGRYFIQAERQLEGSGITLMRMAQPGVPTAEEWLADRMPAANAGTGRRLHQCVRGGIAGKSAGGKKSCPA
ncbi:MAG: aminopeptidase P family N-terminal domain-containing protein [Ruthenibacterium lactatiformans]